MQIKGARLQNGRAIFWAIASYDERLALKSAGFLWHGGNCRPGCGACAADLGRVWWTSRPENAIRCQAAFTDSARQALGEQAEEARQAEGARVQALADSRAHDAEIDVPAPAGCAYLPYQRAGIQYALAHASTLFGDEMGCIDGAAEIRISRAGKGYAVSLSEAFRRFNGRDRPNYNWDPTIPTYARSLCNGELRLHRVRAILDKRVKPVVKLSLTSGKTLRLTPDHEVAQPDGSWTAAAMLKPGDIVLTNGRMVPASCPACGTTEDLITYPYASFVGYCKTCMYRKLRHNHTYKTGKFLDKDGYVRVSGQWGHPRHNRTGAVYEHILAAEEKLGRPISTQEAVHHINGDKTDNRPENLDVSSVSTHMAEHGRAGGYLRLHGTRSGKGGLVTFVPETDTVVSVTLDGEAHVYDMVMDDPYRNFVANGIVCHNCGKSIEALGTVNADPNVRSVLVICPAIARINWLREAQKWLTRPFCFHVVDSDEPIPASATFVIANYDRVIRPEVKAQLMARAWDVLVVDESHTIRNSAAKRTQAICGEYDRATLVEAGLVSRARRKLFLTGTPIPNRPVELWTTVNALAPQAFSNFFTYAQRYCGAHQKQIGRGRWAKMVWDFTGASNLQELQDKLRSTCMIRRLKADVLTELPPKRYQIVPLPVNGARDAVDAELEAWDEGQEEIEASVVAMSEAQAAGDKAAYAAAAARLKAAKSALFTEISRLRHETAVAKLPAVIEHVRGLLDDGLTKVVVFAYHRDIVEAIQAAFAGEGAVLVYGGQADAQRQDAIDRFQTDATCKVFVGSIGACGTAITLHAASTCVFAELDWVPGNCRQAEDRLHRIGQHSPVLIQHLVFDGSLDSRMVQVLIGKEAVADAALDRLAPTYEVKYTEAPQYAGAPTWRGPTTSASVPWLSAEDLLYGLTDASRKVMPDAFAVATDEQRTLASKIVRALASVCDGALAKDGCGYAKCDVRNGHRLAGLAYLNDAQVWQAARYAYKYRGQLERADVEALLPVLAGAVL